MLILILFCLICVKMVSELSFKMVTSSLVHLSSSLAVASKKYFEIREMSIGVETTPFQKQFSGFFKLLGILYLKFLIFLIIFFVNL